MQAAFATAPSVEIAATLTYTKSFSDGRSITATLVYPTLDHAEQAFMAALDRMHIQHKMLSCSTTYHIFPLSFEIAA